ncbi:MAG: DUF1993 domain-containing protein [Tahibacter sp.]
MSVSLQETSLTTFNLLLKSLAKILDKAAAHATAKGYDVSVLLNARLAPDMFTLIRQVQIASDVAKGAVARLTGGEPPKFDDVETTLPELHQRIQKTLDYINSVDASAFEGADDRAIRITVRSRDFDFTGKNFLLTWAFPNFYFHITTAYAILRHNGVDIGKPDFLGLV